MNAEENGELPEGWATAPLGAFVDRGGLFDGPFGSSLKTEDYTESGVRVIRLENLSNLNFVAEKRTFISQEKYTELTKHTVREGDILVGSFMDGAVRVCVLPRLDTVAIAKADCFCVRPRTDVIDPRFLAFQLGASQTHQTLVGEIHGATRPRITTKQLRDYELSLPPLAEQRRIVEAVEAVLANVNAARERLNRVPAILKRFRQAVLSAACSGRLTADWRGDKADAGDSVPPNWESVPLRTISSRVTDGTHLPPPLADSGVPFVLIGNVVGKKIDWSGIRKWVTQATYEQLTARCKPERGDVLYTAVGATYGQALVIETDRAFIFQRHIAHVKPLHNRLVPLYLVHVLNSPEQYQHATEVARGAAQPTVTLADLKEFVIPLPPLAEQQEIVRRVSDLFALADVIESRLTDARRMADQLTQAVLAKAFRGELVPTEAELSRRENRAYEPASELLARIRAERAQPTAPTPANSKPNRNSRKKPDPA